MSKYKYVWKKYRKTAIQKMRPYILNEDLTSVSVSERDIPEEGGMIAKGDDKSQWYISKEFFQKNYVKV